MGGTPDAEPAAFAELVAASRGRVEAVVARMLPADEVEDVVQEAVLRAYLGLSRLREPERFTAWLCGIAVNLAKMRLRRRAVERRAAVAGGNAAVGDAPEREVLAIVREAVGLLPPGQRDVVLMHYVDDLSCEEIARMLGTSPGAVRVRLHRARTQLRRELAPLAPVPAPRREETTMVEMRLEDVLVRVAADDAARVVDDSRIVLLREAGGERLLPIWIGPPEGDALALRLRDVSILPRPLTSDLTVELLRAVGARVEAVAVTELRENVFYATVSVAADGDVEAVDARPSDAINLAVRLGAPILADEAVLAEAGMADEDLGSELERRAAKAGAEAPPGEWASLSAELLVSLHRWRWPGK